MSANRVLVDTSVWIDYFRHKSPTIETVVDRLIDDDAIAICSLVLAELFQGAADKKEVRLLQTHFSALHRLIETPGYWETAGLLAFDLKKRGKTINLADCYLAVTARENNCRILSLDKHFKILAVDKIVLLQGLD